MNSRNTVNWIASVALWASASVPALALTGELQGLHASQGGVWNDKSGWTSGNLKGWQELDTIPCRVKLNGPAKNSRVTVVFPRTNKGVPGFDTLSFLSNSPNLTVTAPPVLNASTNTINWSYSLSVTITNTEEAYVYFGARLANGASANPGSSLQLSGEPRLGKLQIHKIQCPPSKPDLSVQVSAPERMAAGDEVTFTLRYTNAANRSVDIAHKVKLVASIPTQLVYVTNSASAQGNLFCNVLSWSVPDLPPGGNGSVSFKARVPGNATAGQSIEYGAAIVCGENDLVPGDNTALGQSSIMLASGEPQLIPTRIARIAKSGDGVDLYFNSRAGISYSIQSTEDFVNWTTNPEVITGTGSMVISRQNAPGQKRFFRILQRP